MKLLCLFLIAAMSFAYPSQIIKESKTEKDTRMQWWRDARLGMFIHWGLYSIPAGEWKESKNHAEWIRTTAEIPLEEYDKFVGQFNPVKFNAENWVKMAKDAGMKYIVITSKHHDGFCLFDSKYTDFDVMSTPFKRDILKELADACRKHGLKMCFYHSIMDWHHPDYLPRRTWEKTRSTEGAYFPRFVTYLKNQLKEIITNYGDIGVLWFDGEWEDTWTKELGDDLYNYVRSLDKNIIVNNRVSKGRAGMEGYTKDGAGAGDFGTPEQQIPSTGLNGIDWESCITMNDNWGYNKVDKNFKPAKEILRMIADIASKGGNLLLNIGPKSDGTFPQESIDRLKEIGAWMKVNGEAIYSSHASPFKTLSWGRCTQKQIEGGTRLYLHVFDWPQNGKLFVAGLANDPLKSVLLSGNKTLKNQKVENGIIVNLPLNAPDANNSIVVLDINGAPEVYNAPVIETESKILIDQLDVKIISDRMKAEIRYTLDGSNPSPTSLLYSGSIKINSTCVLSAALFKNGKIASDIAKAEFTKVIPSPPVVEENLTEGIAYKYYEGNWEAIPDFSKINPAAEGTCNSFSLVPKKNNDYFGFDFSGYIRIPEDDIYTFSIASDDGSKLFLDNKVLIDNDFCHGVVEKKELIALNAGLHPIRVTYFEKSGGEDLTVSIKQIGKEKMAIPGSFLFHKK